MICQLSILMELVMIWHKKIEKYNFIIEEIQKESKAAGILA